MKRIKYDRNLMQFMSLFSKITRVVLKDCFEDELTKKLVFIVPENSISKAIGKSGANVKKLENILKRKIHIVEFSEDKLDFIKNMIFPLKVLNIEEGEDGVITIETQDRATRGYVIGRNAQNLRNLETKINRYFNIKEIKVV